MLVLCNIVFYTFLILTVQPILDVQGLDPEVFLNLEERVKLHGYPVEIHQVTTEDDYILNMYRIPHGFGGSKGEPDNKSVILMSHGQLGSPSNFITLGKDYAPAYYFANRSFDVWLFCARGVECQNPRKHKKYDWNKDPEYWNYSLHEIGFYDIPASIDYIVKTTGQQKIFYIGNSAGGPHFFIMTTERPEYNDRIKINVNYGQASNVRYVDLPLISLVSELLAKFKNFFYKMGWHAIIPPNISTMLMSFIMQACSDSFWKKRLCSKTSLELAGSYKSSFMEDDFVAIAIANIQRLSVRQVMQYADNFNKGDFRKYDWGPQENMKIYGQKIPPLYNMSACTCANAFFYGTTDSLSTPRDNWLTMLQIPNTILDYEISPKFHHLDYIFAKNATYMVYEPTVKLLKHCDAGIIPNKVVKSRKFDD